MSKFSTPSKVLAAVSLATGLSLAGIGMAEGANTSAGSLSMAPGTSLAISCANATFKLCCHSEV